METVLVIGGSSGIGLATSALFVQAGYKVFNASRSCSPDPLIENIQCDVSRPGDIQRAVEKAGSYTGRLEHVLYSAGFSMAAPVEHVRSEDYRYLFEVNYFGALQTVQAVIPFMEDGGRIMIVSSVGGTVPIPFDAFYSSSKAALDMLVKAANIELNPFDIFLTSAIVGGTSTEFTEKRYVYPKADCGRYYDKLQKSVLALGRLEQGGMSPQEVAAALYDCMINDTKPILQVGLVNAMATAGEKLLPHKLSTLLVKNQYLQN